MDNGVTQTNRPKDKEIGDDEQGFHTKDDRTAYMCQERKRKRTRKHWGLHCYNSRNTQKDSIEKQIVAVRNSNISAE